MMYRLLWSVCFITALICHAAEAQEPTPECWPWQSASHGFEVVTIPESKAQWLLTTTPDHGFVIQWWCKSPYKWEHVSIVGFKDQLDADYEQQAKIIYEDETAAAVVWSARMRCPGRDRTTPGCERYAKLDPISDLLRDSTRPPPVVWEVRDNPTNNSRPTFGVSSTGTRITTATSGSRVSDVDIIGTSELENRCNCVERAIVESGGTYCSVSGRSNVYTAIMTDVIADNQVALCREIL